MVPKKDDSNRLRIDFWKINNLTIKDAHPLPQIGRTIDALQGREYFGPSICPAVFGRFQLRPKVGIKPQFLLRMKVYMKV